ncbi:phage regulatory CII family protein [Cohaesibacter intestini]|uniref:phage regulatory CII family protein n=1 Tax=Cohaesibacter intestini TaxID=2211145 RepID=UPI000DE8A5B8|nr:phage regulatory CII family protein [Cohaesibacter intestini]
MLDDVHVKDRGAQFSFLVRQAISRSERYDIKTIAKRMGLSYQAFYQRLNGSTPFAADEIRRLIAVFPDPSIVSYLLRGTAYVAAERIGETEGDPEDTLYQAAHRVVLEASDVLREIDVALRDHRIDHRDTASIVKEIEDAERSLISLRTFIAGR